jgi:flagellar motor switch protein FliN
MDSQARRKGAQAFAAAFAQSFSEALTEAAGHEKRLEVLEDSSSATCDGAPIQYRIQVEGTLSGECFVEFYEPQIATLLADVLGQRIDSLTDEHKRFFAKFMIAAVKKLETSTLNKYGDFNCKPDPVSGQSSEGMLVVAIATSGARPEMQVSLYFGAELLTGLSSPFAGENVESPDVSSAPAYNLNLVMDVELNASLRFGKRQLSLRDVLDLESGSVVELDRLVDEPVELYLDGKLIARGEAVVVDGNYGLRVTEIPQPVVSQLLN